MKRFLLSVLLGLFGLVSFCSSDLLGGFANNPISVNGSESFSYSQGEFVCFFTNTSNCTMSPGQPNGDNIIYGGAVYCFDGDFTINCPSNQSFNFYGNFNYPFMSSIDCQTEYNLIPINSVDTNYCVSNDLCPISSGGSSSWSELVINDIVHQSAPLINIDIPEEISWDYTLDENAFDLDIEGYNVDNEYISDIILTQKTPANKVDLNNIIQVLLPLFVPGLVIILFIYFAFKFIKKIF